MFALKKRAQALLFAHGNNPLRCQAFTTAHVNRLQSIQ